MRIAYYKQSFFFLEAMGESMKNTVSVSDNLRVSVSQIFREIVFSEVMQFHGNFVINKIEKLQSKTRTIDKEF